MIFDRSKDDRMEQSSSFERCNGQQIRIRHDHFRRPNPRAAPATAYARAADSLAAVVVHSIRS
jgi:hypothetical protein